MENHSDNRQHRLTKKQLRLLRFIHEFREEHGDGPTMAMMVKELSLASNRSAIDMLKLLVANGYLKQNTKISRSTILTSKAYRAIYVVPQPKFQAVKPYAKPVEVLYTAQSTQKPSNGVNPRLSWNNAPQPSGSQAGGLTHEITKLIGNALSSLSYSDKGTRGVGQEEARLLNPLVFMAISSMIIYMMFGSGMQAFGLIAVLIVVISLRSIK